jgi:hypothetical protein
MFVDTCWYGQYFLFWNLKLVFNICSCIAPGDSMTDERSIGNNLEGRDRGLIDVLTQHTFNLFTHSVGLLGRGIS